MLSVVVDLHTHTIFSDGVLLPFELARRAEAAGYTTIAWTDHVDPSNVNIAVPALVEAAAKLNGQISIRVIPGCELTHIPPKMISGLMEQARKLGAVLVIVHGETLVEPVPQGTNRAAIEAGVDILAHPGLITADDAALAAKNNVALEITTRKGHSLSNGHVARMAIEHGAMLVLNNDAHAPSDLVSREYAQGVLAGAGLNNEQVQKTLADSRALADRVFGRIT